MSKDEKPWHEALPETLKIAHLTYDLEIMDASWLRESGRFGEHNGTDQIIRLSSAQKRQSARDTLIHEITHGMLWIFHALDELGRVEEERLCALLPVFLYTFKEDNPEVWSFLFD